MESQNLQRNDFLAEIWLKSEYLFQVSAQRQSLIKRNILNIDLNKLVKNITQNGSWEVHGRSIYKRNLNKKQIDKISIELLGVRKEETYLGILPTTSS